MGYQRYSSNFSGHYAQARKLISKFVTAEKLAFMTDSDVEKEINNRYIAISIGDDWILVERKKIEEFEKLITLVGR